MLITRKYLIRHKKIIVENVLKSDFIHETSKSYIICFISAKFTIHSNLVKAGQLSIIWYFDNVVNGFIFKPDSKTFFINHGYVGDG